MIKRALLSVSDKTGLIPFARFLAERGVTLLSTGGTARALREAGLKVTDVAEVTGFPEILDGRVKTLHPKIHGGILARRDLPEHAAAMREHGIEGIDMVVLNLYPFEETVARGAAFEDMVEQIDIGGPAMLRAAAKNHAHVAIVTDPADYAAVMEEMQVRGGATTAEFRRRLAQKAFARTAAYDAAIAAWLNQKPETRSQKPEDDFPPQFTCSGSLQAVLRYGENPHQRAALYTTGAAAGTLAGAKQLQGKELSYNNLNDTNAAWALANDFGEPCVAIIKHANPCGVAIARDAVSAFAKALQCDPVSAYGGIIALNRPLTKAFVEAMGTLFAEVIIAPSVEPDAAALLAEKKKNLRLLEAGGLLPLPMGEAEIGADDFGRGSSLNASPSPGSAKGLADLSQWERCQITPISGGFLVQEADAKRIAEADLKTVSRAQPSKEQLADMLFAFRVAKHVKSNAIVIARDGATVGIGAGQMSRVDSVRIACWKAEEAKLSTKGAVLASDAFFPFDDNVHRAAEAGIAALIQPGGSIRDEEVIAAADQHGMVMVTTGIRHFRH